MLVEKFLAYGAIDPPLPFLAGADRGTWVAAGSTLQVLKSEARWPQ